MALRNDWDDLDKGQKGDWYFIKDDTYIVIRFGDTMDDICVLPITLADKRSEHVQGKGAWEWNGNRESPTLTPSILVHVSRDQPDKWHGYLTDGKLITV